MRLKYNNYNIGGKVIKNNEIYLLRDNQTLQNLVLSSTCLNRNQQTTGHRHADQEEIYFFVDGRGHMIVGDEDTKPFRVTHGDIVLIPAGAFHRVINDGESILIFNCVFQGSRNH